MTDTDETVPATERAGVVLNAAMTPVQRCIAIVEDSRKTHADWERYLVSMPGHFPGVDVVGDARWHVECVQNYDEVLALLRGLGKPPDCSPDWRKSPWTDMSDIDRMCGPTV